MAGRAVLDLARNKLYELPGPRDRFKTIKREIINLSEWHNL